MAAMGASGSMASGGDLVRVLYEGKLFADYFQIYLRAEAHPDLPDDYSKDALARRLSAGPYAVVLHTARNMTVPVRVEWSDQRPSPDLDAYDHVAEAGFNCPSGRLVLAGLTDYDPTAARLSVQAGMLGVRVNISGLSTLSENGLEGDDRYRVQLWPQTTLADIRVLKAFTSK
jgi:hypothetical protein